MVKHSRNRLVKKREISDVLGESTRNTTKLINNLIDKEVSEPYEYLNEDSNKMVKCFVFNPFIYFRGKDLHRDVYDLFKTSRWVEI